MSYINSRNTLDQQSKVNEVSKLKAEAAMQYRGAIEGGCVPDLQSSASFGDSVKSQTEPPVQVELARLQDRLNMLLNRLHNLEDRLYPVLKEPQPQKERLQTDCSGTSQLAGTVYVMTVLVENMTDTVNTLAERVEL